MASEFESVTRRRPRLLFVDDEPRVCLYFSRKHKHEFEIEGASNGLDGLAVFRQGDFDLVISDQRMPGMNGIEFLTEIRKLHPTIPLILMTAYFDTATLNSMPVDLAGFVSKPWDPDKFLCIIRAALDGVRGDKVFSPLPISEGVAGQMEGVALIDTTAAFIHKLSKDLTTLRMIVDDMGSQYNRRVDECRRDLGRILDSAQYLLQRFRNAVGRHPGVLRPMDLHKILGDVVGHFGHADNRIITLHLDQGPSKVLGDYELLWHLFENLIRNSLEAPYFGETIQESSAPSPFVSISTSINRDKSVIRVRVRDKGSGIAANVLPKIFEPNFSTKPNGLGIGLYLVRRAVAIHAGQIDCQSELAHGTTFTVSLPLANSTQKDAK
jgi:signal transduction histidine kinase